MFKTGLIAATALLALSGAASAQSLYGFNYRATDATPWAGPYGGIHGGGAFNDDDHTYVAGAAAANNAAIAGGNRPARLTRDEDGYVAGFQGGWNVQSGNLVLGLEGDFSFTDLSARKGYLGANGATSAMLERTNYLASERGRVGYALPDGLLIYGTGGYASGEVHDRARFRNPQGQTAFYGNHEYDPSGWAAGVGVEYMVPERFMQRYGAFLGRSRITTGVEYLHYDLGDKDINIGSVGGGVTGSGGGYIARFDNQADVVRARINYKF